MFRPRDIGKFKKNECTKGYVFDGCFIGLTIFYHSNGKLESVGEFNLTPHSVRARPGGRRIGHWKYFNDKGNICKEEIHIR